MSQQTIVRRLSEIEPITEVCGESRRLITAADGTEAGLHVVHIIESEPHYHERTAEIYYILAGWGRMRVGDEVFEVEPGTAIYIPAGKVHAGRGGFVSVVVCVPPFDPEDQIAVDEAEAAGERAEH